MTMRFPQVFNCELLPKNALFRDRDLEVGEYPGLGVEEWVSSRACYLV